MTNTMSSSEGNPILARLGHVAVAVDNFMVVWGGYKDDQLTHSERYLPGDILYIYHSESKNWTVHKTTGETPPGTSGAGIYYTQGKIYIFGGFTLDGNTNSLFCLDLTALVWTNISKTWDLTEVLPSPRDKFSFWSYEEKLYCFGGFGPPLHGYLKNDGEFVQDTSTSWDSGRGWNNQILVYNLYKETWSNPSFQGVKPSPRAAHGSERVGNKVFVFGGRYKTSRLDDLHCLDLDTHRWSGELFVEGASPCGRSWHSFTKVSENVIFLYGGYSNARIPLSDAWQLNVDLLQWSQITVEKHCPRLWHTCVCTKDCEILVFGGCCSNILDTTEPAVSSNTIIPFMIQPFKLQRLCLEAVFRYKELNRHDWCTLPLSLKDWLTHREAVQLKTNTQQNETTKWTVGCCLS